ncbi:MAG: hypothetical protein ABH860_00655, partial [bacterium]
MTEPVITQQINSISQIDDTADIAGGAAVTPSYIASDVEVASAVNETAGIDSIEISSGVSTSNVDLSGTVEKEESSNYIQSDVDDLDMNSTYEISGANKYVDPSASGISLTLNTLKDSGMITADMSEEEIVLAVHAYVAKSFSYIAEAGDSWDSVSGTIKRGGGDCEDLANLDASLIIAALLDRGASVEDANKKVSLVVVADPNTWLGHVYVQYAGDNGSVKYLDPVSSKIASSIDSSKTVLFSYNMEGVNVINKDIDLSALSTAEYTVPVDDSIYVLVNDFTAYWDAKREMIDNAPLVIDALTDLVNTVSWDASTISYRTIIENFISALQSNSIQDPAAVTIICQELGGLISSLNNSLEAIQSIDTVQQVQNYYDTHFFIRDYYEAYGVKDWETFKEYVIASSASSDFPITDEYLESTDPPIKDMILYVHTSLFDIQKWENDPSSLGWNDSCSLTEGSQQVNEYLALQDACTAQLALADNISNSISAANSALGMLMIHDPKQYPDQQVPESQKTYGDYSQQYADSTATTTNYMESMLSIMGNAEYRVWQLNKEIVQISDSTALLNADAAVEAAKAAYDNACTELANATTEYQKEDFGKNVYGAYVLIDNWNCYYNCSADWIRDQIATGHSVAFQPSAGSWDTYDARILRYDNAVTGKTNTYSAWQNAITARDNLRTSFIEIYSIAGATDAEKQANLDLLLTEFKSQYLKQDEVSGFWEVKWTDESLFTDRVNEAKDLKGLLTVFSLIYEAKRDLRKLVEEELTGESGGLKGMAINKMFMKKTEKVEQYIQQTISNLLSTIKNLNRTRQEEEIGKINKEYDEKKVDIEGGEKPKWYEFWKDDTSERQCLENENERTKKINAVNEKYKAAAVSNLAMAKNMLAASGKDIGGNTGDAMWDSINKAVEDALNGIDSLEHCTLDITDDAEYTELTGKDVTALRDKLNGALNMRRIALMAKQAISDMRNLVHQEMTGISGRQSNTDAAAGMLEAEAQPIMMWFDDAVSALDEKVRVGNQIRYNKLEIEKNQKMIDELKRQEGKSLLPKILGAVAMVIGIVAAVIAAPFTGGASLLLMLSITASASTVALALTIAAAVVGVAAGILSANASKEVATKRHGLEVEYRKQVIKPTDEKDEPASTAVITCEEAEAAKSKAEAEMQEASSYYGDCLNNFGPASPETQAAGKRYQAAREAYDVAAAKCSGLQRAGQNNINSANTDKEVFEDKLALVEGLSAEQKTAISDAYDADAKTFIRSIISTGGLTDDQKIAAIKAYGSSAAAVIKELEKIGLSAEQKIAVLRAYDGNAGTFMKNMGSLAPDLAKILTYELKTEILKAYGPQVKAVIKQLESMKELSIEQKTAILEAYDRDAATFMNNLDKMVTLTDAEKLMIIKASDPDAEAYIDSLHAALTELKMSETDAQKIEIATMKTYAADAKTFIKNVTSIKGLTNDQKVAAIKAHDSNMATLINELDTMGLGVEQKMAILEAYDPNAGTFMKNLDSLDIDPAKKLTYEQKTDILKVSDPKVAAVINELDTMGLSTEKKTAILEAYDRDTSAFMRNLDKIVLTDAEKLTIIKSSDPDAEAYIDSLHAALTELKMSETDAQKTEIAIMKAYAANAKTFIQNVVSMDGLNDDQKVEAIKAHNSKVEALINKIVAALGPDRKPTSAEIIAIMKEYGKATFKSALASIVQLNPVQEAEIKETYDDAITGAEEIKEENKEKDLSDQILDMAISSENSTQSIFGGMTASNYLTYMNDGHEYQGSSAFDTA